MPAEGAPAAAEGSESAGLDSEAARAALDRGLALIEGGQYRPAITELNRATAYGELGDVESAIHDPEVARSLTDDPGVLALIDEVLTSITPAT